MRHVSVNFLRPPSPDRPSGIDGLRRSTWLVENAEHVVRIHGRSGRKLIVVFVGRCDLIPPDMMELLNSTFEVFDATARYESLGAEFPGILTACGGLYGMFGFAFIRWLLIDQMFDGEPVVCCDGDVVHNLPLDDLSDAFKGVTRTCTSTAFAAISDREWFSSWKRNLKRLERDPADFFGIHLRSLPKGLSQFNSSPEEYFAKFLIEAGELPHQELPDFPYWIVPQPHMLPRLFNFVRIAGPEKVPTPMIYKRVDGIDFINGKPVAFWHMQKPFMSQLSALAIFREKAKKLHPGRIPPLSFYGHLPRSEFYELNDPFYHLGGAPTVPENMIALAQWFVDCERKTFESAPAPIRNPFHAAFLYDYYFKRGDLGLLFNEATWPRGGDWKNSTLSPHLQA